MRLWGEEGQLKLSLSSVLCIGAAPVGIETLKNLVLAGIQKIGIVDNEPLSS